MRRLIRGLVLALLAACSDNAGPTSQAPPVPESQLHFVRQDPTAPPPAVLRDSFYAKVGENRELRLDYQGGTEFFRFEVPSDGLFRRPGGALFQPGDSILIVVTITDPKLFVVDFQPTGLQFNPSDPARLKVYYYYADHDFNGDGRIDSTDAAIETKLDLWRREPPDTVWFSLGAVNFQSSEELDAKISSFTDHAVAW